MALEDPIRTYYDVSGEREWDRLPRPDDGAIERTLHERAFREFLPPIVDPTDPPAVLVRGDDGSVAFRLAARGYRVTLFAPTREARDAARRALVELPFAVQNRIDRIALGEPTPELSATFRACLAGESV